MWLIIFIVLIVLASVVLGMIILIQNPKGGGLSATFGGVGNQLMGVKQTTDVLEKGTWIFASIVGILCLTSAMFIPRTTGDAGTDQYYNAPGSAPAKQTAPANTPATTPNTNTAPIQAPPTGTGPQR